MKKVFPTLPFPSLLALLLLLFYASWFLIAKQGTIQELKQQVVAIGKLDFKTDIPVRYYNKKRLKRYISARVEEEYPETLSKKDAVFIQLMGFSDRRINLKNIHKKIRLNNVGALYNKETKELWVLNEYRAIDLMNSMIVVHELRHAVQDAHFDLPGILRKFSFYDDRGLAVRSAVEGDAALTALIFNGFDPGVMSATFSSDPLISFSPIGNTAQLYQAPDIVKYRFTMPYIDGLRFVTAVLKKKKWKGVNKILTSPPQSTEQVLHPGKYLKRETPIPVTVRYKPEGYEHYHSGVIGEYYLNILLMEKPANRYMDHAVGWGGDTFFIYVDPSSYFLVWKSLWDEDAFCANFYFAFKRFIESKFQVNFKKGNIRGSFFSAGQSGVPGLLGDDYFFIRKIRNEMIYVRTNNRQQMNTFIYGGNYD